MRLEHFEALVYARSYQEAGRELLRILTLLRIGGEFHGHHHNDETRPRLYSRLASAATTLLTDPSFQLSQEGYDLLAVEHATFSGIFQASVFGNSDHVLRQFATPDLKDSTKLHITGAQNVVKVLLSYSLDSALELDFEAIFRAAPRLALPCFLGMLANPIVFSPAAHRRREKLLTLGPLFETVEMQNHMLPAMRTAYMYCSYATAQTKHEIKRSFSRMMRRLIESRIKLPDMPRKRAVTDRPTMLVPVEWFTSIHAMYRCYAPSLRQLRSSFRLVMIGRETEMDAGSKQLFDDVIELKPDSSLAHVVEQIRQVNPDVIFYPSVGMATWWVTLSTVRLAPIQIASVGHPATTQSEAIDYMLVDATWPGDPSCFSETVIVQRAGSTSFVMRSDAEFPDAQVREMPATLRIAVPSMACKLNAAFLATCQSIARQARRPIEFHFFPGYVGMMWYRAKKEIQRWLPSAVVHPFSHYNEYLRNVAHCDVHLSTFPFGGTNSNIDSMRLGIPMVTLEGVEVHSQTDAGMMRRAHLPEWLIAQHPAEFERAALRLIENDAERVSIARALQSIDVLELFTKIPNDCPQDEFLRVMRFVYENHERIQEIGVRYWKVEQREEFARKARAVSTQ